MTNFLKCCIIKKKNYSAESIRRNSVRRKTMKTKSMHKGLSVLLAVLMLLALIPLTPLTTKASAAGTTYVLDSSADLAAAAAGAYTDGQAVKAGTENFFTIYMSAKTKIDGSKKTFDDGYEAPQRLNFGGKADVANMKNVISFKTGAAATVKIWWVQGGDDHRQCAIFDASGAEVAATTGTYTKNSPYMSTLEVPAAGTYFLGGRENNNNFYKVEVSEKVEAAEAKEYTIDTTADLQAAAAGAFKDGDSAKAGTESFFTLYYSAKTKIDSSAKDFDDGYKGTQRVNFGGAADVATPKNVIGFKADGAGTVKLWWASNGDDRLMTLFDSTGKAIESAPGLAKNTPGIANFTIPAAGTYYVGSTVGGGYIFKLSVTTGGAPATAADWSTVAAPVIASAEQEKGEDGKLTDNIKVTVNAVVGSNGGDAVKVTLLDKDGKEVANKQSLAEKDSHELSLPATATGTYTVKAVLVREGETDKAAADKTADFTLTLKAPTISSVTNKGNGKVTVKWNKVDEATGYVVYAGGKEVKSDTNSADIDGFKVGDTVEFTVSAVRSSETGEKSAPLSAVITKEVQQEWGFTAHGTSIGSSKNKYEGNLNEGKVTVIAQGGAGKLNLAADDGYSFYYTTVPANKNFTFRAKLHVDEWTYSNGQEGFGIAALDSLSEKPFDNSHWTNFYMAAVGRFEAGSLKARQGVGVMAKVGITPENWQAVKDNAIDRTQFYAARSGESLEDYGASGERYNIVGNCKNPDALAAAGSNTVKEYVDFDLEITKNNTGYFMSYYEDGKLVKTVKHWGTEDLSQLDKDNIYIGIVAARNFTVSLNNTDYTIEIRDPSEDPAPEPKPITYVTPTLAIESGAYGNSTSYDLILRNNYKGTATVKVNGATVAENMVIGDKLDSDGNVMETILPVTIKPGKNTISVNYDVDKSVDLGESVQFDKTSLSANITVNYDTYFADQQNIYVAPGVKSGNGSKASPYDLATALTLARPGQKVILKEGTYKYKDRIQVPREVDGTKDAMIYLIADPEAKTRPVLDFEGNSGIGLQIVGDYWYLKGFDVTHAGGNGVRIDGNNCVVDDVDAYYNYGSGISIQADSKFSRLLWPSNNLIKNCDAMYNADPGEEDADGFTAKFCIGVGNVFDNCVAYGNADDGWDLYGRNYPMEPVTVQNCVAYKNGYHEDGTRGKGNGNGFKMGGDNNAARHVLINSVSFMNGADGITNNSNPNIIVKNCITFMNDNAGISFSTKASNTDLESSGVISYKNKGSDADGAKGTQDIKKIDQTYWNGANGVADDWFKSTEFKGSVARNADGSINMEGFLELTDKAPKNAGAVIAPIASTEVEIVEDTEVPNPRTGFVPFAVVAIVLAGAAVAVLVFKRKRA